MTLVPKSGQERENLAGKWPKTTLVPKSGQERKIWPESGQK